jgi:hypothetical protein
MPDGQLHDVVEYIRGLVVAPDLPSLTDRDLLERFRVQRDESAFEALVRRHGPMVLGLCRRILHDPQDAEDAFQAPQIGGFIAFTSLLVDHVFSKLHRRWRRP